MVGSICLLNSLLLVPGRAGSKVNGMGVADGIGGTAGMAVDWDAPVATERYDLWLAAVLPASDDCLGEDSRDLSLAPKSARGDSRAVTLFSIESCLCSMVMMADSMGESLASRTAAWDSVSVEDCCANNSCSIPKVQGESAEYLG